MQPLGYRMEEMIFTLADQNFFFNEIEVRTRVIAHEMLDDRFRLPRARRLPALCETR